VFVLSNQPGHTEVFDPTDVDKNKGFAIVAYILFFIPILAAKESRFAMYHANQGLTLFLTALAVNIVLGIIPILGWILLPFANLAILVLVILGIIAAAQGQGKPLPIIGSYTLMK
jgi:uncharacterized membrane protein